jgi:hypothetical protein
MDAMGSELPIEREDVLAIMNSLLEAQWKLDRIMEVARSR